MDSCDICGKDLGEQPEVIRLYEAQLIGREMKSEGIEVYTAPKVATQYSNKIKPVSVRVCKRHRKDLLKQRAITGLFVFLLIFFPVLFVVGNITKLFSILIYYPVAISYILAIVLAVFIVRTIRYDSLVAVRMTTKAKLEKTDLEYMTETKYRKITGKQKKIKKSPA